MANRLKDAREKKGWTQEELAEKAGISRTTLSYLENEKLDCAKTDTLIKLADALETKVTALFF